MSWNELPLTAIVLPMGCRPSRHASGKVGDSYTGRVKGCYNDDVERKSRKSDKRGKRSTARKHPIQYSKFSTTSKTYHSTSAASKIILRLSTDGSTLQIEQYDIDLTPVEDTEASTPWQGERVPGLYIDRCGLAAQRCNSAPQLTCVPYKCISPSIARSKTGEINRCGNNKTVCKVQVERQSWCIASTSSDEPFDGPLGAGVDQQTQDHVAGANERIGDEVSVSTNVDTCMFEGDSVRHKQQFGDEPECVTDGLCSQDLKPETLNTNQSNRVFPITTDYGRLVVVCRDPIDESQSKPHTAAAANQSLELSSVHETAGGSSCNTEQLSDHITNVPLHHCRCESDTIVPPQTCRCELDNVMTRGFTSTLQNRDKTGIAVNSPRQGLYGQHAITQVETTTLSHFPATDVRLSDGSECRVNVNGGINLDLSSTCSAQCANQSGIVKHYAHTANGTAMYASINQSPSDSRRCYYHNPPSVSNTRTVSPDTACNIRYVEPVTDHTDMPVGTDFNGSIYRNIIRRGKTQLQPSESILHNKDIPVKPLTCDNVNPASNVMGSIKCNFPIPLSNAFVTGNAAFSSDDRAVNPCPDHDNISVVATTAPTANNDDPAENSDDGICLSDEIKQAPAAQFVHEDFQNDFGDIFDETASEGRASIVVEEAGDSTTDGSEYSTSGHSENCEAGDIEDTSADVDFSSSDEELYYDTIEPLYI